MAAANRAGRFRAGVHEVGVVESGAHKLTCAQFRFGIVEEYAGGEWVDVGGEDMQITAYCYIEKRDGNLNTFQVDALKAAFGWPGADPFWFEDNASELPRCQLVLDWETYDGTERLRVRYINSENAEAGVAHSDDAMRRSVLARLGPKLRAISGASAARPAPKPAPQPKPSAAVMNGDRAWGIFCAAREKSNFTPDDLNAAWDAAICAVTGLPAATDNLTPEQWGAVAKAPLAESPSEFGDIPF